MTGHVLISHMADDRETAAYLVGDLERQGVRANPQPAGNEQAVHGAAAVIALASHASSASALLWGDADAAVRNGKPLYVVRLADVSIPTALERSVQHRTDAFGPDAHANVSRLADELRQRAAPAGQQSSWRGSPTPPPQQTGFGAPQSARAGQPKWVMILSIGFGVLLIISGLLKIGGAFDSGTSRSSATSYSARPGSAASASAASAAGVTPAWLIGTWGPNCPRMNTGGISIIAGTTPTAGTVSSGTGTGTWTLSGNTLTTYSAGRTEHAVWTNLGPNDAQVLAPNGQYLYLKRCPAGVR